MVPKYLPLVAVFLFTSISASSAAPSENKWHLTWSDEFNAPNGTPPDATKWAYELGANGWLNEELESYTARSANAEQRDGNLVITARKEEFTGADGIPAHYTSARLRTLGLFAKVYGRFEARIQLPLGKGIWPAFWMMGADIGAKPWPACGEIDIFENIGEANRTYSSIHGPGYNATKGITKRLLLPEGQAVNTAFHLYAVEWEPNVIRFYVDDVLVVERTPADLPPGTKWVYDHPFFMLLNVAVGGTWPGSPDTTTVFPQRMLVDYVRVYSGNASKTL